MHGTVKLTIQYDGTDFSGFERQTALRTVQGELESALFKLYNTETRITPSGRTDAGVHALAQVVSFTAQKEYAPEKIVGALNFFLPLDIRAVRAETAPHGFNARKSAKRKTYFFDFYISDTDNPLLRNRAVRLENGIDTDKMKKCARHFVGEHDFSNFHCVGSSAKTTVREVYECRLYEIKGQCGEKMLRLEICANGFLYKMVRLIAGALIRIGQGKTAEQELIDHIACTAVCKNKIPAPACGLYLVGVEY